MVGSMEVGLRFISLHNDRNVAEIERMCTQKGVIRYSDDITDTEQFFQAFDSVYFHTEDTETSLLVSDDPSNSITLKIPVVVYWREIAANGNRVDHFSSLFRFVRLHGDSEKISDSWTLPNDAKTLSIRERRKLKRKAIKFHGKRMREAQIQEDLLKEGDRWRKEGDTVDPKKRELIREQKREYWRKKHDKFDQKRKQKLFLQALLEQLTEQEKDVWENGSTYPEHWIMPRVCIDMSFLPLMDSFAHSSVRNQLASVYNLNLEATNPFKIYLSSSPDSAPLFEDLMSKQDGMKRWVGFSVHPTTEVDDLLPKPGLPIVYLSPDAEDVLEDVDDGHLYVIGGLCDRDRKRNITKDKCDSLGIKSCRLPIDEYVSLDGSKILTINAVFAILCTYFETKNWTTALTQNLPKRSIAKIKSSHE